MTLTDLQELERDFLMPTYARNPVEFVRGEGTRLWDADGNEYLDFLAGISVVQIGERHSASAPSKIFVPVPAIVNSSRSSEWGSRPSTMWALVTPESTA